MFLEALLTDTIDVYRATAGPGVQTGYGTAPYESGIQCLIQPIQPEYNSKTDKNFGRAYNCLMMSGTDISLSDRVVDENGKTYQVTGSYNYDYGTAAVSHITVVLTEEVVAGPDI